MTNCKEAAEYYCRKKKEVKSINEIKIRFKNGNTEYFKLVDDADEYIENIYNFIGNAIRDGLKGVFEVIDLVDYKKTLINIQDITSIGYSKVDK